MKSKLCIRSAVLEDAEALRSIYAPYVTETAVTFEYEVPSTAEFRRRMIRTLSRFPYLVAEQDGQVVGYAYVSPFHPRAAYAWCAETTIYVARSMQKTGIGHSLYQKLEQLLEAQHILNLYACIAYPNPASISFHESFGYHTVGHFHHCGYKLGHWHDMVWMEKIIGGHEIPPEAVGIWKMP